MVSWRMNYHEDYWCIMYQPRCITWSKCVNSLAPGRCQYFKDSVFKHIVMSWPFPVELSARECQKNSLVISQYWSRYWLGAIRQQAINWSSVEQDIWCHRTFQTHCGLVMPYWTYIWNNIGSGNGQLSDGTKPFPKLLFIHHQQAYESVLLDSLLLGTHTCSTQILNSQHSYFTRTHKF